MTVPGEYAFYLQVTDNETPPQATQTPLIFITVDPALEVSLTASPGNYISFGQSVTLAPVFTGGTGGVVYKYSFPSGDGITENALNANVFTFANKGSYVITINASDNTGEIASNTITIDVSNSLTTTLTANRTLISADQSVHLTNMTQGGTGSNTYTYTSNPSTGVTFTDNNALFNEPGNYVLTLTVNDISGEVATNSVEVDVTNALTTTLTANRTLISAGQSVYLTNTTTGGTNGNTYSYTSSPSTGVTFTGNNALFADSGNYVLTLTVNDISGEVATNSVEVNVTNALEITNFGFNSIVPISAGQSVFFTNTTTGGTGSNVWTYYVDGNEVTPNVNGSITFANAGNYVVNLNVIDQTGETANAPSTLTFEVTPQLTTQLIANRTLISAGQSVYLTNATSGSTGGNTYAYTSVPSTGVTFTDNNALFNEPGNYVITLTVNDISGEVATNSVEVNVTNALEVGLVANRTTVSPGQSVMLSATPSQGTGNYMYSYTFPSGDGITENALNANAFTFSTAGNFIITVNANNAILEVAQATTTVTTTTVTTTTIPYTPSCGWPTFELKTVPFVNAPV